MLNKDYYKKFHSELNAIFKQYKNGFKTVSFEDILNIMGIDLLELDKLKNYDILKLFITHQSLDLEDANIFYFKNLKLIKKGE